MNELTPDEQRARIEEMLEHTKRRSGNVTLTDISLDASKEEWWEEEIEALCRLALLGMGGEAE